jgi:hypothetical protein
MIMPHFTRRTFLKLSAATNLAGLATVMLGTVPSASAQRVAKPKMNAVGERAGVIGSAAGAVDFVVRNMNVGKPAGASYQLLCQYLI